MTTSRPAQLAPVRTSGSGDTIRAGEAATDPITRRTCQRTQPRPIQLINAALTRQDG
ncbi:hypothetical protein [Salinispora pacifica]|uniref:hypothetical protein n=1 Tax=Salinispora pacifica TaxID=351187 RepID=UPI0004B379EE|nr:hypothetical protein [Salinispora pacifica]